MRRSSAFILGLIVGCGFLTGGIPYQDVSAAEVPTKKVYIGGMTAGFR